MRFALAAVSIILSSAALAQRPVYPASKHGGTYMFNYYLPPAPSTTPWCPGWSPDGKWIVYTADDGAVSVGLEIVNVDTGEAHALTQDKEIYADPVFSP